MLDKPFIINFGTLYFNLETEMKLSISYCNAWVLSLYLKDCTVYVF